MMNRKLTFCALLATGALQLTTLSHAGTIVQCGADICSSEFQVMVDNQQVGAGQFTYDATTGDISLNTAAGDASMVTASGGLMWDLGDNDSSTFVRVDNVNGNADPILGFSVAAGTGNSGSTFAFAFDLPIALDGPIQTSSDVGYTLTSTTQAGAQISPINNKVVTALEVDTSVGGIGNLNKGVDVGDSFFFVGVGQQTYDAVDQFGLITGDPAYDLMAVNIAFSLSANSNVGVSGFVQQTPVPVPAAIWLFGSALGLLGLHRKKAIA